MFFSVDPKVPAVGQPLTHMTTTVQQIGIARLSAPVISPAKLLRFGPYGSES